MNPYSQFGASAYANVGLESGVASADPHRLVLMLYEGAMLSIRKARQAIMAGDIEARGRAISKAIQIIEEGLVVALDPKANSALATQLRSLYQYMAARLLMAALKNDVAVLDEVSKLLGDLQDAWKAIDPRKDGAAAPVTGMALAA